jgi:hypothetical protein
MAGGKKRCDEAFFKVQSALKLAQAHLGGGANSNSTNSGWFSAARPSYTAPVQPTQRTPPAPANRGSTMPPPPGNLGTNSAPRPAAAAPTASAAAGVSAASARWPLVPPLPKDGSQPRFGIKPMDPPAAHCGMRTTIWVE